MNPNRLFKIKVITVFFMTAISFQTYAASLTVVSKKISDNTTSSQVTFTNIESIWSLADQYLEVDFSTTELNWGIQIYTNNQKSTAPIADPMYSGPTTGGYEGAGLIGVTDNTLYCPLGWAVFDEIQTPAPSAPTQEALPNGWAYFKDPLHETVFVSGEDYITFINNSGIALNDGLGGRGSAVSPIYIYLVTNAGNNPNQVYRTNQLTVELYHQ